MQACLATQAQNPDNKLVASVDFILSQGMLQAHESADSDALKPAVVVAEQPKPPNAEHWRVEPTASTARCRVIQEGDPQPGLAGGRMQFAGSSSSAQAVDPQVSIQPWLSYPRLHMTNLRHR